MAHRFLAFSAAAGLVAVASLAFAYVSLQPGPGHGTGRLALAGGLSPPADITPTPTESPPPKLPPAATITIVDGDGKVGTHNGIAVGADGVPLVAYIEYSSGSVRVAHCGNASCTAGNTITTVANAGGLVEVSVAVGADGLPLIAYTDFDYSDGGGLTVVHCGDVSCSADNLVSIVDDGAELGGWVSLAVGADGLPVMSYLDTTGSNFDLKVAHCGDILCGADTTVTTVDGSRIAYSALVIGADGLPVISYIDADHSAGDGGLKVLHCGNAACSSANTISTVDNDQVASYTSIAVGADGLPVVTHTDGRVSVVQCGNLTCSAGNTSTIIEPTLNAYYTSIATGADGLPVIAYADPSDLDLRHLKVARCGNTSCSSGNVVTILDSPMSAMTPSLAVGADGLPVISYSGTGYSLNVAHCNTIICAKPPAGQDSDSDGCTDDAELGSDPSLGGQRNPKNFWDFIDQWTGLSSARDRSVTGGDISAVVARFGSIGDPSDDPLSAPAGPTGYHTSGDRGGAIAGQNAWNLHPPDGSIVGGDLSAVVAQFGHVCA